MKYEWTWQDDEHLADLFREAERQRAAFEAKNKVNWWPVVGGLAVITFFGLFCWGAIDAYIWVTNWFQ